MVGLEFATSINANAQNAIRTVEIESFDGFISIYLIG